MVDIGPAALQQDIERPRRPRKDLFTIEREQIADRVLNFFRRGLDNRSDDREIRLQRYAKFRMWTEGKDWPWAGASDIALPEMMEKSLRVQDTLHNAVMSTRPPISSTAVLDTKPEKERNVDSLIDYQVFREQNGEEIVGELADAFVNDGVFTAFIPWVTELREIVDSRIFAPLPPGVRLETYLGGLLQQSFPGASVVLAGGSPWEWRIDTDDDRFRASFFTTDDDEIEMLARREVVVYDGPRIIVKDYDDVIYPPRSANLQMPSPSNPGGAPHVILRDHPTIDEIVRLQESGSYNLMTKDEVERLKGERRIDTDNEEEEQKDNLAGQDDDQGEVPEGADDQRTLTRLICFDVFDVDGDGKTEDVVWWVIQEPRLVVKAKLLTELNPSNPPRRPFAEASFIPVRGRRAGISLLEMMEGIHDEMKVAFDQMVDSGTIANAPFGFYRPSGSGRPEVLRMTPGELYPLGDPSKDINFPTISNQAQPAGINLITLLQQMQDKVTVISDLQLGRVPPGRSAALRTTGNMAILQGQAEARPERILRRFFIGLTQIWAQIHQLNERFLPEEKKIRVIGIQEPGDDPYLTVNRQNDVSGRFLFDFDANILNTSKAQLQQSLSTLLTTFVSGLALQMGMVGPEEAFRLFNDFAKSLGINPVDRGYLRKPSPDADRPLILAEEAMSEILAGGIPNGVPAEPGGAAEHMQKLIAFTQDDRFGLLQGQQIAIFRTYLQEVQQRAAAEARQAALAEQANQLNAQPAGPQGGGNGQIPGNPPISGSGELLDETLPGAGGGAQQ